MSIQELHKSIILLTNRAERIEGDIIAALLHKSGGGRTSPFPGQTYPMASVTGMPSAV